MISKIPSNLRLFIKKKKSISIDEYINFCLFNDRNGYYQKQKSIGNDFTTSPEVSQIFGETIGFLLLYLKKINRIDCSKIIELGPGNGTLTSDILNIFKKNSSAEEWDFLLIEKSDTLKKKQVKKLEKFHSSSIKINWSKKLNLINEKKPLFIFCNEFFDSLPINQFVKLENFWVEKRISINESGNLCYLYNKTQKKIPNFYKKSKTGSLIEISNLLNEVINKIFEHIANFGGAFLLIDYGPFEKKNIDTLQSIYKKKKCGILEYPCFSDITHHIDLKYIHELSKKKRLSCYGPISQKQFLLTFGAKERLKVLINSTKNRYDIESIINGYNRLLDINQMGELFKCMLFTRENLKFQIA